MAESIGESDYQETVLIKFITIVFPADYNAASVRILGSRSSVLHMNRSALELQRRIEPQLLQFNLHGYHVQGLIYNGSSEGIIFSFVRNGYPKLIIKIKILESSNDDDVRKASKEAVEMIRLADNRNVAPILAHFALLEQRPYLYCIVEKHYSVLSYFIKQRQSIKPTELAVRLGVDMCNAFYDCQNQNPNYRIIHRDVKFQNIFFDNSIENGLLLADFGIAVDIERTGRVSGRGTPTTVAPEVALGL